MAQLVERLLPTPEVCGSNPVIGNLLYRTFIWLLSSVLKRRKIKEEVRNGQFFIKKSQFFENGIDQEISRSYDVSWTCLLSRANYLNWAKYCKSFCHSHPSGRSVHKVSSGKDLLFKLIDILNSKNTHILCKGKYICFNWFG